MTNFLFWNVKKQPNPKLIRDLCDEHNTDVLALAECGPNPSALLPILNRGRLQLFDLVPNRVKADRVRIFTRFPSGSVESVHDDGQVFIRRIIPPIGVDALLVAVHFGSKRHLDDNEQMLLTFRLSTAIRDAEAKLGHRRTIVIGDLNMNPFEAGMIASDGLHAVMDRLIATPLGRRVKGQTLNFFYNPMWRFFGDKRDGPPGTYFLNDGSPICYFWNISDQVLIRPELISRFSDDRLKIVDKIGEFSLLGRHGRVDTRTSDHLPIAATVELERL